MKFRQLITTLGAIFTALAIVTGAASFASATDNATDVNIYANNAFCAGAQNQSQPVQGHVNFHLDPTASGDPTLHLNIHLQNARPDATYTLEVFTGFCSFRTAVNADTNDNGVANVNMDTTVPAGTTSAFVFGDTFTGGSFSDLESLDANLS